MSQPRPIGDVIKRQFTRCSLVGAIPLTPGVEIAYIRLLEEKNRRCFVVRSPGAPAYNPRGPSGPASCFPSRRCHRHRTRHRVVFRMRRSRTGPGVCQRLRISRSQGCTNATESFTVVRVGGVARAVVVLERFGHPAYL